MFEFWGCIRKGTSTISSYVKASEQDAPCICEPSTKKSNRSRRPREAMCHRQRTARLWPQQLSWEPVTVSCRCFRRSDASRAAGRHFVHDLAKTKRPYCETTPGQAASHTHTKPQHGVLPRNTYPRQTKEHRRIRRGSAARSWQLRAQHRPAQPSWALHVRFAAGELPVSFGRSVAGRRASRRSSGVGGRPGPEPDCPGQRTLTVGAGVLI